MTTSEKREEEWGTTIFSAPAPEPEPEGDDPDPEDETIAGDDEPSEASKKEIEAGLTAPAPKPKSRIRVKRSVEECEGLVSGIDDETVGTLLSVLAKEAIERGIDPMLPVTAAKVTPSGETRVGINDVWGRIVTSIDRTKRGGFRFDGSPIYGRSIMGRELSSVGVGEDGRVAPVVFGRKDMRGTLWLAVAERGISFDMSGVIIVGMKLVAKSDTFDSFEKLCDAAEAMLAGVEATKVSDRRTTEAKLASLDDWE